MFLIIVCYKYVEIHQHFGKGSRNKTFIFTGAKTTMALPIQGQKPPAKPFAPLGNRKALVEKSGLVKHATNRKQKEKQKETKGSSNRYVMP